MLLGKRAHVVREDPEFRIHRAEIQEVLEPRPVQRPPVNLRQQPRPLAVEVTDILAGGGAVEALEGENGEAIAEVPHGGVQETHACAPARAASISAMNFSVGHESGDNSSIPVSYTHLRAHETPEHL